ncbi:hypothetical protein [Streptomyces sp. NBC_01314]|uniref:hypothetical protein n=1 Tax=Streptomyces sp. NBC_01314 TaxID=2903821 RepID=UPI00352E510B
MALGDQIEPAAAAAGFGPAAERCWIGFRIGSATSNIGHPDTAAGIAGLIKVVLMLSHRILAPTVNLTVPRAELMLDTTPFALGSWR